MEICAKNYNFGQIAIFDNKNWNFLVKIEIWAKNYIFGQNRNFWTKSQFLDKIPIFGQNHNFWTKSQFLVKIANLFFLQRFAPFTFIFYTKDLSGPIGRFW